MITNPSTAWSWVMLLARTVLFIAFQALFAVGYLLAGSPDPWGASARWWPITVTLCNLVCIALLLRLFRTEGMNYWHIFRIQPQFWRTDLLAMLGMLVIAGPIAFLPGNLIATWLYGDTQAPLELFFRPLPLWGAIASLFLFPLTQGLAELPTYFGYSMPRISRNTGRAWLGFTFASLALGLQHLAMPLLFDWRFITWRGLMYVPFAFLVGGMLLWRPRLMPYLVIVHILIDALTVLTLLTI